MLTVACNRQQNSVTGPADTPESELANRLQTADSLYRYLQQHIPAIGFSPAAFQLDSVHHLRVRIDNVSSEDSVRSVLHQMNDALYHSYLKYAVGQRYGFANPTSIFNSDDYDVKIERPDSAFYQQARNAFDEKKACAFLDDCEPKSKAYRILLQSYQSDSTLEGKKKIALNLERLRWRDKKAPAEDQRYIFVNIPTQQVWAIAPDSVFSMKICCGSPSTRTPILTSNINRIDVNPEWNIPTSIIRNEVSHRAGDSAYFARNGYYITDRTGHRVNPKDLTSSDLAAGGYRVAQYSGAGNSLGRIIFRFPNRFSVYLHDTSNKSAFDKERRTVSHGCVRLQRPFDVARFVLPDADGWLLDRIRLSMDLSPESEKGRDYVKQHGARGHRLIRSLDVTSPIPVSINYFTVYPNPETDVVETWPDRYNYDSLVEKGLKPFLQ